MKFILQLLKNNELTTIWTTAEKNIKRTKLIDFVDRKNEALIDQKVKSLIDLDEEYSASIRSVAIKKNNQVKLTTRFLRGKMLMFSKVSIKSFVYDLIDVFMFPNQEIREIFQKYQVEKCYLSKLNWHRQQIYVFCFYLWFKLFHQRGKSSKYNIWGVNEK